MIGTFTGSASLKAGIFFLSLLFSVESFSPPTPAASIESLRHLDLTNTPNTRGNHANASTLLAKRISSSVCNDVDLTSNSRRALLQFPIQLALLTTMNHPLAAGAATATMEKAGKKMTAEEAEVQFIKGYETINYLLDNYPQICEGGGDKVRSYLGTIVSNPPSPLVGINKVLKALEDRADDFIEYTELSEEVIKSIQQADGSAYMSIFVMSSTSYTPPQKYFDDAKIEIKRCKKSMSEVASMVGIKLT